MADYDNMSGLAGNLLNPYSGRYNPNSQYSTLKSQNTAFGDYGTQATNKALSSNPNLPTAGSTGGDTGLFGLKDTTWGNIGMAGQLGLGLANTLTAMDQLRLQKDAFAFNKDMKNKEYAMAKDAYDRNVARAASIGEQMRKGQVS